MSFSNSIFQPCNTYLFKVALRKVYRGFSAKLIGKRRSESEFKIISAKNQLVHVSIQSNEISESKGRVIEVGEIDLSEPEQEEKDIQDDQPAKPFQKLIIKGNWPHCDKCHIETPFVYSFQKNRATTASVEECHQCNSRKIAIRIGEIYCGYLDAKVGSYTILKSSSGQLLFSYDNQSIGHASWDEIALGNFSTRQIVDPIPFGLSQGVAFARDNNHLIGDFFYEEGKLVVLWSKGFLRTSEIQNPISLPQAVSWVSLVLLDKVRFACGAVQKQDDTSYLEVNVFDFFGNMESKISFKNKTDDPFDIELCRINNFTVIAKQSQGNISLLQWKRKKLRLTRANINISTYLDEYLSFNFVRRMSSSSLILGTKTCQIVLLKLKFR